MDNDPTFYAFGWNGTTVTSNSNTDASVHCTGPLAFITNKTNSLAYLATAKKATMAERQSAADAFIARLTAEREESDRRWTEYLLSLSPQTRAKLPADYLQSYGVTP